MAKFFLFVGIGFGVLGILFMYLRVFGRQNHFADVDYKSGNASVFWKITMALITSGVLPILIGGLFIIIYFKITQ